MWREGKYKSRNLGVFLAYFAAVYCVCSYDNQSINYVFWHVSFRSAEGSRYSPVSVSEPCPQSTSEQDGEDNREDLAPLNLSTRNQDKEKSPSDRRIRCSDTEELKRDEVPLNLSLRASYSNSAQSTSEDLPQKPEAELDEEPCDQRQTAALALCQLAIASSAASSRDVPLEVYTDTKSPGSPKKTKHTTKTKTMGTKRANNGQTENNCHKPNKRSKASGRALRRRPRCC